MKENEVFFYQLYYFGYWLGYLNYNFTMMLILMSLLSGVLYRMGGIGKPFNTKCRDFGVPAIALITIWLSDIIIAWWVYLFAFGLMFGSMTTYCKFGQNDVRWWNWLLTGILYGL